MTTGLGLYAAPVTVYGSLLTAVSGSLLLNYEIAGESVVSGTLALNLEVADETAVSGTLITNYEIADSSVPGGSGSEGGTPDTILNLPTYAKASRLRADFHQWNVFLYPPARTFEYIGQKVGSAPLASITDFSYSYELDAVGEWSILIPVNDERASVILDGTAEAIRLFYEDVGHILTGKIDSYEIVDSETMRVSGRDLLFTSAKANSLWRIDTFTINYGSGSKTWKDYYSHILNNYVSGFPYQFDTSMPNKVIFSGSESDEWIGIVPKYQSQSILDVLRDMNSVSGAHFRIHPSAGFINLGEFGDDSGLIIAPIGEDDPTAREDGALVLKSFNYEKTNDELVNMLVVQGSNDSFGIAVELRHALNKIFTYDIPYLVLPDDNESEDDTVYFPGGAVSVFRTKPSSGVGDYFPIDLIPDNALQTAYEEALTPSGDDSVEIAGGHVVSLFGGSGGSGAFASVGYPDDQLVVAIPFTLSESVYPTFASVMNMGGIGKFYMAICPSSGGLPDTSTTYNLYFSNYFQNTLPGNYVQTQSENSVSQNSVTLPGGHVVSVFGGYKSSGGISREDREFGIITELMGFMDLGTGGSGGLPWPLLTAGDYFLLVWSATSPTISISGFPYSVHYGSKHDRLRLLKNSVATGAAKTAKFLDYAGNWQSSNMEVIMSLYGRAASSSYPYAVEGMLAETVKDNGSGHRVFYMRDLDSIGEYGIYQGTASFPGTIDYTEGVADIIPASDLLHDQSQLYLENRKDPFEKLTVTCTGLFKLPYVGQKVRFVYRGMAFTENGAYKWLDIDSLWYVLSINWQISNEGLEHTLTLTKIPDDVISPHSLMADLKRQSERTKNNLGELIVSSRRVGDGVIKI